MEIILVEGLNIIVGGDGNLDGENDYKINFMGFFIYVDQNICLVCVKIIGIEVNVII